LDAIATIIPFRNIDLTTYGFLRNSITTTLSTEWYAVFCSAREYAYRHKCSLETLRAVNARMVF
jgi:hypothetical protein